MRDVSIRVIEALLDAEADIDVNVRSVVSGSLYNAALKDLGGVLRQIVVWLRAHKHSSTSPEHRLSIFKAINEIILKCSAQCLSLTPETRDDLIGLSVAEMTSLTDLNCEWVRQSSRSCVLLCEVFPQNGLRALLERISNTGLPHFFVLQSLADIAESSPFRFLPFVKDSLAKIVPILASAKQDNHKMVCANAVGSIAYAAVCSLRDNDLSKRFASSGFERSSPDSPRSNEAKRATHAEFNDVMRPALNFLLGDWSRASEQKVRIFVSYAVGATFCLCSDETRTNLVPRVLPFLLQSLKRERPKDAFFPARGFLSFLSFILMDTNNGDSRLATAVTMQMEAIVMQLLQSIVAAEGEPSTESQKTLDTLLGAAENIADFFLDGLITTLQRILDAKSQVKDPLQRAACLTIIQHLSSKKHLEPSLAAYRDSIIATVRLGISEGDYRSRIAVAKCIIQFGITGAQLFKAVGGNDLLSFIIRNAAIPDAVVNEFNESTKKKGPPSNFSPEALRDLSRNALALFSSTNAGRLDCVLWPFLLEHFNEHKENPGLLHCFPTVCRCLVQIGARVSQTDDFYIDFNVSVNVPRPAALVAKFIVQVMQVDRYSPEELHTILECMSTLAPLLDDPYSQQALSEVTTPIANLWLATIPELQELVLKGEYQTVEDWEEIISKLATKTITVRQSEMWVEEVLMATLSQLSGYTGISSMFRSCLILTGITISKCSKKDIVAQAIHRMIDDANHDNADHRQGLAKGLGITAALHPDLAVEKLTALSKGAPKRGFFSFGSADKEKSKEFVENSKCVSAFGLCYASRKIQPQILTSRLDASILPVLSYILQDSKSLDIKLSVFQAVRLLESPLRKHATGYVFKGRDAFIELLLSSVTFDSQSKLSAALLEAVGYIFSAIASLVSATPHPLICAPVVDKMLVFSLQYITKHWPIHERDVYEADEKVKQAVVAAFCSLLQNNKESANVDVFFQALAKGIFAISDQERARSTYVLSKLIECLAEICEEIVSNGANIHANISLGKVVAHFIPRIMDANPSVREQAFTGIIACMKISAVIHPEVISENQIDSESCIGTLVQLRSRAATYTKDGTQASDKEASSIIKSLCACIVTCFPDPKQFVPLLDTLLSMGITDPVEDSANCCCVVMHGMVRGLGATLSDSQVRKILDDLLTVLPKLKSRENSLNGALVSLRNLVKHHGMLCLNALLSYEVPHSYAIIEAYHTIGNDASLAKLVIQHSLDKILNSQLVEESADQISGKSLVKSLARAPFGATQALGWVCEVAKGAETVRAGESRTAICGALFFFLAAAHEFGDAKNISFVTKALRIVAENTFDEISVDRLERFGWIHFDDSSKFTLAIQEMTKYLSREGLGDCIEQDRMLSNKIDDGGLMLNPSEPNSFVVEMAEFVLPYIHKPIQSFRRAAINITCMLLRYSVGDTSLLQSILTALLSRSGTDENSLLRTEALHGFRGMTCHKYEMITHYIAPVLSALLANFNDHVTDVALAAMISTQMIIQSLPDRHHVAPIVVNILLKAKSLFESKHSGLRKESYSILHQMIALGSEGIADPITIEQQVQIHLPTLLVHLEEDDARCLVEIKEALKCSLEFLQRRSSTEVGKTIGTLISHQFIAAQPSKTSFVEFSTDFAFLWVANFSGRVNDLLLSYMGFFASDREILRSTAALHIGLIIKNISKDDLPRFNVDQSLNALMHILNPTREKSAAVRARAAQALGRLQEV